LGFFIYFTNCRSLINIVAQRGEASKLKSNHVHSLELYLRINHDISIYENINSPGICQQINNVTEARVNRVSLPKEASIYILKALLLALEKRCRLSHRSIFGRDFAIAAISTWTGARALRV
jgi:hypothetical protein